MIAVAVSEHWNEFLELLHDPAHWAFEIVGELTTGLGFWLASAPFWKRWFNKRWVRVDNETHGHDHKE